MRLYEKNVISLFFGKDTHFFPKKTNSAARKNAFISAEDPFAESAAFAGAVDGEEEGQEDAAADEVDEEGGPKARVGG